MTMIIFPLFLMPLPRSIQTTYKPHFQIHKNTLREEKKKKPICSIIKQQQQKDYRNMMKTI